MAAENFSCLSKTTETNNSDSYTTSFSSSHICDEERVCDTHTHLPDAAQTECDFLTTPASLSTQKHTHTHNFPKWLRGMFTVSKATRSAGHAIRDRINQPNDLVATRANRTKVIISEHDPIRAQHFYSVPESIQSEHECVIVLSDHVDRIAGVCVACSRVHGSALPLPRATRVWQLNKM